MAGCELCAGWLNDCLSGAVNDLWVPAAAYLALNFRKLRKRRLK